ncbi:unnamed protein product, partial [Bubo scandiacus]
MIGIYNCGGNSQPFKEFQLGLAANRFQVCSFNPLAAQGPKKLSLRGSLAPTWGDMYLSKRAPALVKEGRGEWRGEGSKSRRICVCACLG